MVSLRYEDAVWLVRRVVADFLGVSAKAVQAGTPFDSYGLDSLDLLEIQSRLEQECSLFLVWTDDSTTDTPEDLARAVLRGQKRSVESDAPRPLLP